MEPFIGQIVIFAGDYAPRGWALCDGQLLPIAANQALFSILGTTYGGDRRTTFGLPDLRGRVPIHPGTGPRLTPYKLGQRGGTEAVTLQKGEMPSHNHPVKLNAVHDDADRNCPTDAALAIVKRRRNGYIVQTPDVAMIEGSVTEDNEGGDEPHDNMQPHLCINFLIALQGTFPARN